MLKIWSLLLLGGLSYGASTDTKPVNAPIDLKLAQQYLSEATQLCRKDGGRLWGKPLCGPIMLVDPKTRMMVTNQQDPQFQLKSVGGIFTGNLPEDKNIWNTNVEWSGVKWAQIMWPLSTDDAYRRETFMHELFHLIQPDLGFHQKNSLDPHLNSLEGRYLMQLEWRALKRALVTNGEQQVLAIKDALLFRKRRHQIFAEAAGQETQLELIEGTASYTGVKLASDAPDAQVRFAIRLMDQQSRQSSFVKSFAYASGPAYGLLLDHYVPDWKRKIVSGMAMAEILQNRLHCKPGADLAEEIESRALLYEGKALRVAEEARESERHRRFNKYRTLLVDGPTLWLPNAHMAIQIDPERVLQFDGFGSIYLTLRVVADWGILTVSDAAMIDQNGRSVTVSAPFKTEDQLVSGYGWTLQLKDGWTIVPNARPGDFRVKRDR